VPAQQARHDERGNEVERDGTEPDPERVAGADKGDDDRDEANRGVRIDDLRHDVHADEDDGK